MRDGWTETTLNQVLLSVLTRAKDNSDYEVLSVTERRGIIPQTEVFNHRIATDDISKYKVLQPGDIAFNPYLLWCGAVGQWKGNYEGVVSPVYECFRVRETDSPRFVGLIFESGVLTPYFDSTAIGSIVRRRRTTLPVFYEAPIFRPPLEEQKRIVDLVSSVDAYTDALQQQANTARTARNAVLHELLSAGGDGWTETTLGGVAVFYNGKAYKQDELLAAGRYRVLRVGNFFSNGNWYWSDLELDANKYCDSGDLLYAWSASFGPRIWTDEKVIYHYHIWKVEENPLLVEKKFLYYWLEDDVQRMKRDAGTGSIMMHITKGEIEVRAVALPPIAEQKRIVEIVSAMDDVIQSTEQAVTDAKNLRSGLLSDLLSGEREIPASYDSLLGAA